ncbi:MAG: GntR family transcriptional regulator [Rhizobiaceae bacterium]|nr:GntR family transcriptional regulator [Rhizobiaceae bacterium]
MKQKPKTVRRGDSATRVFEGLRADILAMRLMPGAMVDEAAIARQYDVSRTPVREAVNRLATEGLVSLLPNKGSQVSALDLSKIKDYLEAMDLVQRAVTVLAARRRSARHLETIRAARDAFEDCMRSDNQEELVLRNRDLHAAISQACGNELLSSTYDRYLDVGLRVARFTLSRITYETQQVYEQFLRVVADEHRQMVTAIETGDEVTAEKVAHLHTVNTRLRFNEFLAEGYAPRRDGVFESPAG